MTAVVSEPSDLHVPSRDGAQTPSQNAPHPPPLPSTSNNNHTYAGSVSTPTSKTFTGHQSQSQSVPVLASPTTDRPSVGDTHTRDESLPNSSGECSRPVRQSPLHPRLLPGQFQHRVLRFPHPILRGLNHPDKGIGQLDLWVPAC